MIETFSSDSCGCATHNDLLKDRSTRSHLFKVQFKSSGPPQNGKLFGCVTFNLENSTETSSRKDTLHRLMSASYNSNSLGSNHQKAEKLPTYLPTYLLTSLLTNLLTNLITNLLREDFIYYPSTFGG